MSENMIKSKKFGTIQKGKIASKLCYVALAFAFFFFIIDQVYGNYMFGVVISMIVATFQVVYLVKVSKTQNFTILYISKNRCRIRQALFNEAKRYAFHSNIMEKDTDHPYFTVTTMNMKTKKISIRKIDEKWYLIEEILKFSEEYESDRLTTLQEIPSMTKKEIAKEKINAYAGAVLAEVAEYAKQQDAPIYEGVYEVDKWVKFSDVCRAITKHLNDNQ